MAKLYFSYAAMNAGKSTMQLQASYNYRERGRHTLLFTAAFDDRAGVGRIAEAHDGRRVDPFLEDDDAAPQAAAE